MSSTTLIPIPYPEPPTYTPSTDPPAYTEETSTTEQSLASSLRVRRNRLTSIFTRLSKRRDLALNLYGQHDGASCPTYGRNAKIEGSVALLKKDARISRVLIKVEGHMKMVVADGGSTRMSLFTYDSCLWQRGDRESNEQPRELPFHLRIPLTCEEGIWNDPLPPSYEIQLTGVPGLRAVVEYSISVIAERSNSILKKTQTFLTPFKYLPRSRAPAPIISSPHTFLSTIKNSPEEWSHHESIMKSRSEKTDQIRAHLIIPRGHVYPLRQPIPFHVQLTAPPHSIRELLAPRNCSSHAKSRSQNPKVAVSMIRQVMVNVNGQKAWQHCVIGDGRLSQVITSSDGRSDDYSSGWAAWDGEITFSGEMDDYKVGGFSVGKLQVKDFIVLTLTPEDPTQSPLLIHQHSVPIRLVSDSFDIPDGML